MRIFIDAFIMIIGLHVDFLGWLNDRYNKLFTFFQILEYLIFLGVSYFQPSDP